MATIAKGTTVKITNTRGTVKGVNHVVKGVSAFNATAVDTLCGQTFLTVDSRPDRLAKIATATDAPVGCKACAR